MGTWRSEELKRVLNYLERKEKKMGDKKDDKEVYEIRVLKFEQTNSHLKRRINKMKNKKTN